MSGRQAELVERLGKLAAIDLRLPARPDHPRRLEQDLEQMVAFVSILNEFDDAETEDDRAAITMTALRGDHVVASQTAAEALANAPQLNDHFFCVPLMVG